MGAWGSGPFDNDAAADWLLELADAETSGRAKLEQTLARSATGDQLTAPADEALAAMALVAMAWNDGLRERWSPLFYSDGLDIAATLTAARTLRSLAANCVPLIAASDLADLWGDDEEWWMALQSIATAVGYGQLTRPASSGTPRDRVNAGFELVTRLGLRQYQDGLYLTTDSGDIVKVPVGTPSWQHDELAALVLKGAFRPDEDHDHSITDNGDLVRREIDARLRTHLRVHFRAPSGNAFDVSAVVTGFLRAGLAQLEELLGEVVAGTDLEELVRRSRDGGRDRERPSGMDVCTLADWRSWRALGASRHRASLAQRVRELIEDVRSELDGA